MEKEIDKIETPVEVEPVISQGGFEVSKESLPPSRTPKTFVPNRKFSKNKGGGEKKSFSKPRAEFDQKIISLRRVTRVVAGGRRFSFSVGMVIGDRKGRVGVGLGKAADTALAIDKAIRDAKRNMIHPKLSKTNSIPFDVEYKYCASRVMLVPAPGKGLKVGGAARAVLGLLGAKDITGKIFSRSKNHINNARATIEALRKIGTRPPQKKVVVEDSKKDFVKIVKKEKV